MRNKQWFDSNGNDTLPSYAAAAAAAAASHWPHSSSRSA